MRRRRRRGRVWIWAVGAAAAAAAAASDGSLSRELHCNQGFFVPRFVNFVLFFRTRICLSIPGCRIKGMRARKIQQEIYTIVEED